MGGAVPIIDHRDGGIISTLQNLPRDYASFSGKASGYDVDDGDDEKSMECLQSFASGTALDGFLHTLHLFAAGLPRYNAVFARDTLVATLLLPASKERYVIMKDILRLCQVSRYCFGACCQKKDTNTF